MAEASAFSLSNCFTQLTGRKVNFVQTSFALDGKVRQAYGVYSLESVKSAIIVKADLVLLGSIAGALVGLPDASVKEHLKDNPLGELMRDAISEVLNVAAAAVTVEGRAVFQSFVTDPTYMDSVATKVFKNPFHRTYFTVQVEGYQGGRFAILAPFVPASRAAKQ